jgi:hypothetical protein
MLKFLVQIFYQPLFTILFPLAILFSSNSFPPKSPKEKNQAKDPKNPSPLSAGHRVNRVEQRLSGSGGYSKGSQGVP